MTGKPIFLSALILAAVLGASTARADSDRGRGHGHWKHDHSEWRDERDHRRDWKHHRHHHHERERVVVVREYPVYVPPPMIERPRAVVISTPDIVIPF
jgi:Ni/Co efflux regulator RcnB